MSTYLRNIWDPRSSRRNMLSSLCASRYTCFVTVHFALQRCCQADVVSQAPSDHHETNSRRFQILTAILCRANIKTSRGQCVQMNPICWAKVPCHFINIDMLASNTWGDELQITIKIDRQICFDITCYERRMQRWESLESTLLGKMLRQLECVKICAVL